MTDLITVKNINKQTNTMLFSMPNGNTFARKFDTTSNMYKFWRSIAMSFMQLETDINRLFNELHPKTCNELIRDWEIEYGIPDGIFNGNGTLAERIRDIQAKLSANNLITRQNFIDFFTSIGYSVDIQSSKETFGFPIEFPYVFGAGERLNRFIVLISFAEDYPNLNTLKEFVQKLVPANVLIMFKL